MSTILSGLRREKLKSIDDRQREYADCLRKGEAVDSAELLAASEALGRTPEEVAQDFVHLENFNAALRTLSQADVIEANLQSADAAHLEAVKKYDAAGEKLNAAVEVYSKAREAHLALGFARGRVVELVRKCPAFAHLMPKDVAGQLD